MTGKWFIFLVDKWTKMILKDHMPDISYIVELMSRDVSNCNKG